MGGLSGFKIVSMALNLPGPVAARSLSQFGARVIKVEPPGGDPMAIYHEAWYRELNAGQQILNLDLKISSGRERLFSELVDCDLLLTSTRPDALQRLGLGWDDLHRRFPRLCMVGIVGYPAPYENLPGHDLTYQAKIGLLTPPAMPRTLVADMAGAEKAVSAALALLLARERGQGSGHAQVALSAAADFMAEPYRFGVTAQGNLLGGRLAEYNIYQARDGWVAVAALELHFRERLASALKIDFNVPDDLRTVFITRTAVEWESWAEENDLPIVAVK